MNGPWKEGEKSYHLFHFQKPPQLFSVLKTLSDLPTQPQYPMGRQLCCRRNTEESKTCLVVTAGKMGNAVRMFLAHPQALHLIFWV